MPDFNPMPKIGRYARKFIITEKIDGTNASIFIGPDGEFLTGSRTRWITPQDDNAGFSRWAHDHKDELMLLGEGHHFGEWWGNGIQRNYGLNEKRFSLFNVGRWSDEPLPACVSTVPTIGAFNMDQMVLAVDEAMDRLKDQGSYAAPGFMKPEGAVIYHTGNGSLFKRTFEHDESGKGNV